ncbi:MAG: hypothetical protein ABI026_11325 [Gemmatimonadaceae bacterium]
MLGICMLGSDAGSIARATLVESRLTDPLRGAWVFAVVSRFTLAFEFDIGLGSVSL